jgi:hypothetical protein
MDVFGRRQRLVTVVCREARDAPRCARARWAWFPNHAGVRSAQNRLTRVPLGQARAAVRSSALGVTGDSNHSWAWFPNHAGVRSAQNRLTRVPLGQARAAVRSSALGVTGGFQITLGSGVRRIV